MKKQGDSKQLSLNLKADGIPQGAVKQLADVVPFIDAGTLETRRNAVRRVARSGIFSLPPNLRLR